MYLSILYQKRIKSFFMGYKIIKEIFEYDEKNERKNK
jgi:hypothetical protein